MEEHFQRVVWSLVPVYLILTDGTFAKSNGFILHTSIWVRAHRKSLEREAYCDWINLVYHI